MSLCFIAYQLQNLGIHSLDFLVILFIMDFPLIISGVPTSSLGGNNQ